MNFKWEKTGSTHYLKCNGITLARIWSNGKSWQIAVQLPDADVEDAYHATLKSAVHTCEQSCREWAQVFAGN